MFWDVHSTWSSIELSYFPIHVLNLENHVFTSSNSFYAFGETPQEFSVRVCQKVWDKEYPSHPFYWVWSTKCGAPGAAGKNFQITIEATFGWISSCEDSWKTPKKRFLVTLLSLNPFFNFQTPISLWICLPEWPTGPSNTPVFHGKPSCFTHDLFSSWFPVLVSPTTVCSRHCLWVLLLCLSPGFINSLSHVSSAMNLPTAYGPAPSVQTTVAPYQNDISRLQTCVRSSCIF